MPASSYEAYRLAKMRMADAHREAEQRRLAKSVEEHRDWPGWLRRLELRARQSASIHPDGGAAEARPGPRRPASTPTR